MFVLGGISIILLLYCDEKSLAFCFFFFFFLLPSIPPVLPVARFLQTGNHSKSLEEEFPVQYQFDTSVMQQYAGCVVHQTSVSGCSI